MIEVLRINVLMNSLNVSHHVSAWVVIQMLQVNVQFEIH